MNEKTPKMVNIVSQHHLALALDESKNQKLIPPFK